MVHINKIAEVDILYIIAEDRMTAKSMCDKISAKAITVFVACRIKSIW